MLKGVEELADAVKVTMGPRVCFFTFGFFSIGVVRSVSSLKFRIIDY